MSNFTLLTQSPSRMCNSNDTEWDVSSYLILESHFLRRFAVIHVPGLTLCLLFYSQIKFVILLTVNHTIIIILSQRTLYWIIFPKLIFFFIHIYCLVDIVLIL